MSVFVYGFVGSERSPRRLLQLPFARNQALLDSAVGADQRQHASPLVAAGVNQDRPVGCIAWRNIKMALGQHLDIATATKIQGRDAIGAILLNHERQLRLIRGEKRPRTIAALKGEPARLVAGPDSDLINLRAARAV